MIRSRFVFGFVISCVVAGASFVYGADAVPRIAGVVGNAADGTATFTVSSGPHQGTYNILHDIKGLKFYPDAHVIAYNTVIDGKSIDFQKFEWERLEDFILSKADLLEHWELPKKFPVREIAGASLAHLPSKIPNEAAPTRGIAQRLVVHVGSEVHSYQIRFYDFPSSSAAAMFAERWSAQKGVMRDSSEHFRRAFEKTGVWILNGDDERKPPDYWIGRFILESISRKALIAFDTAKIFNKTNSDAVVFTTNPDTVSPGDLLVLIGQGFSPFLQGNYVVTADKSQTPFRIISSTSHQLTVEVPRDFEIADSVKEVKLQVYIGNYAMTNPVIVHVQKP